MSKVPCDPAVGNLRFSKHRRVACVVLACGVVMDTSVLSLGYLRPYPATSEDTSSQAHQFAMLNRVTISLPPRRF